MNKVFTNNEFIGHYPVGSSAVVIAIDRIQAALFLQVHLKARGLNQKVKPSDMKELSMDFVTVVILNDGDY